MSKKYIYDDKGMNVRKSEGTTVLEELIFLFISRQTEILRRTA